MGKAVAWIELECAACRVHCFLFLAQSPVCLCEPNVVLGIILILSDKLLKQWEGLF
jgi:hypothetical protein